MGLQVLKGRIHEEVRKETEQLERETSAKTREINEQARETISKQQREYALKTSEILERMETRERLNTQLIAKKAILAGQRDALIEVVADARHRIVSDEDLYERFLRRQLISALSDRALTRLLCSHSGIRRVERVLETMEFDALGMITIQEDERVKEGFAMENNAGTVRLDATLHSVLEQAFRDCQQEIRGVLWPEEQASPDESASGGAIAAPEHPEEGSGEKPEKLKELESRIDFPPGTIIIPSGQPEGNEEKEEEGAE